VDRIGGGAESYKLGYLAAEGECAQFIDSLPTIIRQAISEYMRSPEVYGSQKLKDEGESWWMEHMRKLQEQAMKASSYGEGSTMYKCPNCDVEYFSSLLMAFHMFDKHAITTRKT
jgi:hypothetical protein